MTSRMRRWRRVTIVFLVCGIALWLAAPSIARAIIRRQLQGLISDRLNARLEIGSIVYRYPYGVSVFDATIIGKGPEGMPLELLRVARLNLQLAKLPMPGGPLVIQSVEIIDPAVHVIRESSGVMGKARLAKAVPQGGAATPRAKLSEMFRLKHLALRGGRIVYEDSTKPGNQPMAWRNLNGDLEMSQQSAGSYAYHLVVDNSPLATLEASGSANVDELTLGVEKCSIVASVDPGAAESSLPPEIQAILREYGVMGKVAIGVRAKVPLANPGASSYATTLELSDASARVPRWGENVDQLSLKAELADGLLKVEALRGKCGTNLLFVKRATARIDELPARLRVTELEGCATFGPERKYPSAISGELSKCKPVGPFFFGGSVAMNFDKPNDRVDYDLNVHTTRGSMTITERMIAISAIDMSVGVTPSAALIHRFEAAAFGGNVSASGRVDLGEMARYSIQAAVRNVDLHEVGQTFTDPGQPSPPLSGRGVIRMALSGAIPKGKETPLASVVGQGEFEITRGDFWRVPVMKMISDHVLGKESVTVGDAAGQFRMEGQKIHLDHVAATSPALGVDGSGDVGLDGSIKLKLIANVGGRWADRAGDLGDGGGVAVLANAVQKGLDSVSRQLLYEVGVSGTTSKPVVEVIAAPIISRRLKQE